jgi:hypothetical protein
VIRAAALTLALVAALLVAATPGRAADADECKGLKTCIPVIGPWVAIPAPGGLATTTSWKLICPQGVIGGVDARASEDAVAVEFPGLIGSPINPGITTSGSLVFRGTYSGRTARATSYQPFIGCIPTPGGGPRTRVSFNPAAAIKPGQPVTTRVKSFNVRPGVLARATLGCKPAEHLIGNAHGVGFYTQGPPTKLQIAAVHVIEVRSGRQVLVSATSRLRGGIRAVVQVQAVCAR